MSEQFKAATQASSAIECILNGLRMIRDNNQMVDSFEKHRVANVKIEFMTGRDTLLAMIDELEMVEDERQLVNRLSDLLERTANALKGPPAPLHLHDWSDLPDVAAKIKAQAELFGKDRE